MFGSAFCIHFHKAKSETDTHLDSVTIYSSVFLQSESESMQRQRSKPIATSTLSKTKLPYLRLDTAPSVVFPPQKQNPKPGRVGFAFQTRETKSFLLCYNAQGGDPVTSVKREEPVRPICMGVDILIVKIGLVIPLDWVPHLGSPYNGPQIPQLRD